MIVRSAIAKIVSVVVAVGLLTGAMQLGTPDAKIEIEGGGEPLEAQMGSRFEDMSVGTLTAMTTEDVVTPTPPEKVEQADASELMELMHPTETKPVVAKAAPAVPIEASQLASVPAAEDAVIASVPVALTPLAPASVVMPSVQPQTEMVQAALTPETIVAVEPDSDAPTLSKRPARKNPELAAKAAEVQEKAARDTVKRSKPKPKTQKATRGNAKKNNTRGAATGTQKKATVKKTGKKPAAARQAGNAAVSNYPGKVMRRISRLSKPRVKSRGTAVISFAISSGGGLSRVSVSRSSGSASLDQAAVKLIHRAAPFPRPPAGARRKFSISIKGR